ncbi:hypothetical protein MRB53_009269 [Persea americana]|uniref:Uncharacterized protein n=1 Tax=Persea americana TaxID=3435 RepID=A0ACC2LNN8_PERAE|nr:hypothetical protein MRB53_009269 [Persea americana]
MRAAVKLKVPAFLLSQRRKPGKSSLPPVRAAVKLKLPAFLLSQRRKAGKCEFAAHASGAEENWKIQFTADESGGNAESASFPPLTAEETWKIQFTAGESDGKAEIASFPPLAAE